MLTGFCRTIALTAVAAAIGFVAPVGAQQPAAPAAPGVKNLKIQSTWAASWKIEAMAAGQIVPPFEVLDATHKKVIDGAHAISYYWVGKNKAATLFSNTP